MKPTTVSLFCGAGGESAGKELAFRDLGIDTTDWTNHAINHWNLAVATHGANFPGIHVHQEDITQVTAATFGVTHIDLLWASPSCVYHSRARGGKPRIALMHSELSEALEGLRRGNPPSEHIPEFSAVEEELADVIIRIADAADAKGWRVGEAVVAKIEFNRTRPYMHGGKLF